MRRSRRNDEDRIINQLLRPYKVAGGTLLLAFIFAIAWAGCLMIGSGAPTAGRVATSLFASFFGWGAVVLACISALQYAYAYFYPHFIDGSDL